MKYITCVKYRNVSPTKISVLSLTEVVLLIILLVSISSCGLARIEDEPPQQVFHEPVLIEGVEDLQRWVSSGSGTVNDPYVIRELVIDVSGEPYCLALKGVGGNLILKNCVFRGATSQAIHLENVGNIWVVDCVVENSRTVLGTKGISGKVVFVGNTFRNNAFDVSGEIADPDSLAFDDGFVGNYWDKHVPQDDNGDGICDISYTLRGPEGPSEKLIDRHPLIEPLVGWVTSPDGILLSLHYSEGEEFRVCQTSSARIVSVPGGTAEVSQHLLMLNRVVDVQEYGTYVIETVILEDDGTIKVNGFPQPYESQAGIATLQRIHRFGTVPDPGYGVASTELTGVDIGVQLPVRRVNPGDRWTATWTVGAETLGWEEGEQELTATYTFSRFEEVNGLECAVIEARLYSTAAGIMIDQLTGARIQLSIEMTFEATAYFSLAQRRIIKSTGTARVEQIDSYLGLPILRQVLEINSTLNEVFEVERSKSSQEGGSEKTKGSDSGAEEAPKPLEELESRGEAQKAQQAFELGLKLLIQGEFERAERVLVYAAQLFHELGNQEAEAGALFGAGMAQQHQEKYEEAITTFERAAEIYRQISRPNDVAACLNSIGLCYRRLGQHEVALSYYEQVLELAGADDKARSAALLNMGVCLMSMGHYDEAIAVLIQARALKKAIEDMQGETSALVNIGACYRKLGLYEEALKAYDEAIEIGYQLSDPMFEASARQNKANCLREMGLFDQALAELRIGRKLWRQAHNPCGEAGAWIITSACQLDVGDPVGAWSSLEKALKLCATEDVRGSVSFWQGWVRLALGDPSSALSRFEQALEWAQAGGDLEAQWRCLWGIGKSQWLEEDLIGAVENYEKAIDIIEKMRSGIQEAEVQQLYHGTVQEVYKEYLELLLQLSSPSQALWYSERARARSILDILAGGGVPGTSLTKVGGLTVEQTINAEEISDLIDRAPEVLLENEAVLVYALGTEHLFIWVVTKERGIQGPIIKPCKYDELLVDVYTFRSSLERQQPTGEFSRRFYDLLIEPVEEMLAGKDTLIIIPSGPLWYVPFAALQPPGDSPFTTSFLIQRYAIAYAPSLASLPVILATGEDRGGGEALAFVNPDRPDMPAIPPVLEGAVRAFVEAVGGGK